MQDDALKQLMNKTDNPLVDNGVENFLSSNDTAWFCFLY